MLAAFAFSQSQYWSINPPGQRVLASTTHLDNAGSESRAHIVAIILNTLKRTQDQRSTKGALPVFLAGDFNSFPNQEAFLSMSLSDYVYDLRDFAPLKRRYNDQIAFTTDTDKDKDEQDRLTLYKWDRRMRSAALIRRRSRFLIPQTHRKSSRGLLMAMPFFRMCLMIMFI
jgi:endonuclease/exonuclease/phosphatase family metal-dependent hydrolase